MTQAQANKPERIVILSKAFGAKWETVFFEEIQAAILDGYRIAKTNLRDDASMRNFRGRIGKAVMYLEGCEPEAWKPAVVIEVPKVAVEEAPKVDEKELSTGAPENSPVDPEKNGENDTTEADAAKLAKEQEEAVKAEAEKLEAEKTEKKAKTAEKAKATKVANKAKKEADKAK